MSKRSPRAGAAAERTVATRTAAKRTDDESTPAPAAPPEAPDADDWMRPRSAFKPGYAPPRRVIEWVAGSMKISDIEPVDAPDSTAWGLLCWARGTLSNAGSFYQMWAKLVPSRTQVDEQESIDDDDSELADTLEFVYNAKRDALLRSGAEGASSEPPFPRTHPPRDEA